MTTLYQYQDFISMQQPPGPLLHHIYSSIFALLFLPCYYQKNKAQIRFKMTEHYLYTVSYMYRLKPVPSFWPYISNSIQIFLSWSLNYTKTSYEDGMQQCKLNLLFYFVLFARHISHRSTVFYNLLFYPLPLSLYQFHTHPPCWLACLLLSLSLSLSLS